MGSSATNGFAVAVYLCRLNINNDFYVNAWRCAKRAQAEYERVKFNFLLKCIQIVIKMYTFLFVYDKVKIKV